MTKFDGFESPPRDRFRRLEAERPQHVRSTRGLLGRTPRAGDKRACEALVDVHHCALALTYVRSHEVADEIVQETWVAVLARIDRIRGRSSLKTRILLHRAHSRVRAALEVHLDG